MQIRDTYLEVVDFLSKSGGAYQQFDTATYRDIIDSILDNRFRIVRDDTGAIIAFTSWWMIHERDIELVKSGNRPTDVTRGTVVYVADHAGQGAIFELIRFVRATIGKKGVCWHHRYKQPGQFRYYPKEEGANV
jgi:hemolysin-activating ACP:hemolysin acyltransferase